MAGCSLTDVGWNTVVEIHHLALTSAVMSCLPKNGRLVKKHCVVKGLRPSGGIGAPSSTLENDTGKGKVVL